MNKPGNYEVPLGIPFNDLLEMAGGVRTGHELKAVIPGGASCPILPADQCEDAIMDYDGMRELVRELTEAGCAWGVITNKMEALALPLMTHMAFDPAPACVIGGDSAGVAKPDPAPMYLACKRIGVDPTRCIYVGDSDRDVAAGRAAGMATIGVAYGYIPPGDDIHGWNADVVVNTVADLLPAIERLKQIRFSTAKTAPQ